MNFGDVQKIADAILYEGHALSSHQQTAINSVHRWTFGAVYSSDWSSNHPADRCERSTQIICDAPRTATVDIRVRFLQIIERCEQSARGSPKCVQEARERTVDVEAVPLSKLCSAGIRRKFNFPASRATEYADAHRATPVMRSERAIQGTVMLSARWLRSHVARVQVRITNNSCETPRDHNESILSAFATAHVLLRIGPGTFVSLTDPPESVREEAAGCSQEGLWPVLAGNSARGDTVLASPVVLDDYPQVADQCRGRRFDRGEIDQTLTVRIATLSSAEPSERCGADGPRQNLAARTQSLPPDDRQTLHRVFRHGGSPSEAELIGGER